MLLAEIRSAIGCEIKRYGFSQRSSVWQIRKLVGYVSSGLQQAYQYNICVYDAVATGFFSSIGLYDLLDKQQENRVKHMLSKFGLIELSDQGVHQISSGHMRRVLIARAMVQNPDILIFDEITANLDRDSRSHILANIKNLAQDGKTMIFVGHHDDEILSLANKILTLRQGEVCTNEPERRHRYE